MDVRDRYEAQVLERRRLALALRRGTEHSSLLREAHPNRLVAAGLGVALLAVVGAGIAGLASPAGAQGLGHAWPRRARWRHRAALRRRVRPRAAPGPVRDEPAPGLPRRGAGTCHRQEQGAARRAARRASGAQRRPVRASGAVEVDLVRLRSDVAAGKVPGVEVLPPKAIEAEIQTSLDRTLGHHLEVPRAASPAEMKAFMRDNGLNSPANKDARDMVMAMANTRRDSEWLVRGHVPADYLVGPYANSQP